MVKFNQDHVQRAVQRDTSVAAKPLDLLVVSRSKRESTPYMNCSLNYLKGLYRGLDNRGVF